MDHPSPFLEVARYVGQRAQQPTQGIPSGRAEALHYFDVFRCFSGIGFHRVAGLRGRRSTSWGKVPRTESYYRLGVTQNLDGEFVVMKT